MNHEKAYENLKSSMGSLVELMEEFIEENKTPSPNESDTMKAWDRGRVAAWKNATEGIKDRMKDVENRWS